MQGYGNLCSPIHGPRDLVKLRALAVELGRIPGFPAEGKE